MIDELIRLGQAIRRLDDVSLPEVASTRALTSAARLVAAGLTIRPAATAATASSLSDDDETRAALTTLIESYVRGVNGASTGSS